MLEKKNIESASRDRVVLPLKHTTKAEDSNKGQLINLIIRLV